MVSNNVSMILDHCPPIDATSKSPDLSKNYKFVSSRHVVDILGREGWFPREAFIVRSKSSSDPLFKRHCIRFENPEMQISGMGGVRPEIVMRNSHDGTTSLQFLAGIMRMVCSNGLTISEEEYGATRMRHDNAQYKQLGDMYLNYVVKKFARAVPEGLALCKGWDKMMVDSDLRRQYYMRAGKLRGMDMYGYRYGQFDVGRRRADESNDLWTMFNRTQENLIRGGVRKYYDFTDSKIRSKELTPLKNADAIEKVNTGLWNLTTELAGRLN